MAKPKRPRDINQLAKNILDIVTGEVEDKDPNQGKNIALIERAKKGGLVGGKSRAEKLSATSRKEIAKKAAEKRWKR